MSKFKNKTSKLLVLVIGALIALTLSLIFSFNNGISAFAADVESFEITEHGRAHIDEDFEDDNVVVVLDSKISKINKIHSAKYFDGIDVESITAGSRLIYLHTSGHATAEDIKKVCEITQAKTVVPIHCERPENFLSLGVKAEILLLQDGESITL